MTLLVKALRLTYHYLMEQRMVCAITYTCISIIVYVDQWIFVLSFK